ncbi:centrosome-associated protein 350-like isoform X2 [Apostichopus japonicus]|uniref:centrosome-associated protein 350-like isoform X2 n=1 Tax=Stichopus japonicus TaxID=307972 RepID=UPI003AB70D1D
MTSVRGRRTVEVHPVQRGNLSKESYSNQILSATDLKNAWSDMNEAKRVLHRAETRVNDSGKLLSLHATQGRHMRSIGRPPPSKITPTQEPVTRVPGERAVTKHLNGDDYTRSRRSMLRRPYLPERDDTYFGMHMPGYRHSANRNSNASTSYSGKHFEPRSSQDILEQGSANLSLDDNTDVRILNDVPTEEPPSRSGDFTVEVSPGLKVNTDYIPFYERLYGGSGGYGRNDHEPPVNQRYNGDQFSLRTSSGGYGRTRHGHDVHHGYHGDKPSSRTILAPTIQEKLRQRVEMQKQRTQSSRTPSSEMSREHPHKESDPVLYRPNGQSDFTVKVQPSDAPIRKVARAPPPPHYKGFNVPQTNFRLPNGRVVSEETMNNRKHKRKEARPTDKGAKDVKPLQPSKTQADNDQNKPTRKVRRKKGSSPRKPRQPDTKVSVGVSAWREGIKAVREALGPSQVAKTKVPRFPPSKDGDAESQGSAAPVPVEDDDDEKSGASTAKEHSDVNGIKDDAKLPSEACDVLEDLELDADNSNEGGDAEDDEPGDVDLDTRHPISFIVEPGQRKPPLGRGQRDPGNEETSVPVSKVRHYDSREVRKYMVQQKNKRKKKQQEQLQEKEEAANRKQKQLDELYKKQKDNAKVALKDGPPAKRNTKALGETFRKEPQIPPSQPIISPDVQRLQPRTQAMRKLDVTSSDKENKAFWSTSSSDNSSRSSPQTDISGQPGETHTGEVLHPANREVTGDDIVLIPVTEEGAPITVVGRQKVLSPEQNVVKTSHPTSSDHGKEQVVSDNGTPASNERLKALKATAAALQGRLDNEVKKLASEILVKIPSIYGPLRPGDTIQEDRQPASPLPGHLNHQLSPPSMRSDRPLSPRHLTWHNQFDAIEEDDRWAFSVPSSRVKHSVKFQDDQVVQHPSTFRRTLAAEQPNQVFTGMLPGVGSMSQHAAQAYEKDRQDTAATKIQASYRGHNVREKLKWAAPTVSSVTGSVQTRPNERAFREEEEHFNLSEGALSDDASVELVDDYLPKFQSLRATHHHHMVEPIPSPTKPSMATSPESISNILRTPSAFEPTNDGLSVVDIFTRRYQQAQRSLLASRAAPDDFDNGNSHPVLRSGGVSANQDKRSSPQPQTTSPGLSLKRPTTLEYSDDDFHSLSSRTPASAVSVKSKPSPQMASGASEHRYTPDFTDTSMSNHSEGRKQRSVSKMPESENSQRSEDGRRSAISPHSYPSSPGNTASISGVVRTPLGTPSASSQSRRMVMSSPCSLPLSPTHEKPTSSKSPQSDPGQLEVRRSPLGSNLYSSTDEEVPRSVRSRKKRGRRSPSSRRSPMSPDTHRIFLPISSPVVPPATNPSPALKGPPPPPITSMVGFSPSALQLKMASELNLMDMLDASAQQLNEMEHARTIALAHEESAALARILEGRQKDYERQLQLLSLKSQQEVEDAHRQLREVRQEYAHEAMELEKQQTKAQQDAAELRRAAADRLLQSQAETSRITAEAAKQLAEAHTAAVKQPPPPPPGVDASRLLAENTQTVVSAVLEQQRLHQLEMLKEMKSGFKSPPPPRRSLGVGVNMSQKSLLSRSPNRSPTPHYTEDFTQSSPSSQSVTRLSTTHSKGQSPKSSSSIAEESLEQADGFKTPPRKGSPPPTEIVSDSPVVNTSTIASHYSLKSIDSENDSSIHTDSDAKRTVDDIGSISEKLDDTKSPSDENSISFENSATDVDSVVDTSDRTLSVHSQRTKEHNDAHHHQSLNHGDRSPEARSATLPGQEDSRPMSLLQDSTLLSPSPPAGMRVNLIKQQLEEEDARAQQQMALLDLREKALVDKTQAELQWLEHQKRLSKSKRDEEGLELLRRKQRNLYAKMTREQEEIKLLKDAQVAASKKRDALMEEQERISRLQQSTQQLMARTRTMTPLTPHLTSFESHASEESPERSKVVSLSSSSQDQKVMGKTVNLHGVSPELHLTPSELSPADKQVRALQNVKLNARSLSKRAFNLKKRRKEAEELLAWKEKLDQEEEAVKKLEQQVKSKLKTKSSKSSEKTSAPATATPSTPEMAQLTSEKETQPSSNSEVSAKLDSISSGTSGETRTKSKAGVNSRSKSEVTRSEDPSVTSSVTEEIETDKSESRSKKSPTRSPVLNSSSEETVKDASQLADYANESFDSVDQTLTQAKSATPSPLRTTESNKSSPSPGLLSPNRRRQDPESGSESERSLSQTFSETASDQSDIEGRIRALSDSLKKRKVEADKLRKQQKRLYREKLKAQEASLKKQLETYDSFIVQTRKELVKEKDAHSSPLTAGAKPQIKHLSISETQRKRDQSHTRALRQRTASESSVESSVEIAKKRGQGFTENRRSSRTSLDEDNVSSNRDVNESQEGERKKQSDPASRSRSLSGDSSVTEDLSLRSLEDVSLSDTSLSASLKVKERLPEEKLEDSLSEKEKRPSLPDTSAMSPSTESEERRGKSESRVSPGGNDRDGARSREGKPDSSEIPEELSSIASNASSLSIPAAPSANKTFDFGKRGDGDPEDGSKSIEVSVKSSRDSRSPSLGDDKAQLPLQSPRSHTSSVKTMSPKNSPRKSPRTDPSYSEDFQESSVSIHLKEESKSDTEDDISEHLSDRSTASGESQASEKFVARPLDMTDKIQEASMVEAKELDLSDLSHHGERKELEESAEITVSPRIPKDAIDKEVEGEPKSTLTTPEVKDTPYVDPLPNLPLGCRVEVKGGESGILRFKGPLKSGSDDLVGIELDQQDGTTDGTLDGTPYFSCAKNHGIFVSPNDVKEESKETLRAPSGDEDFPSQSSVHTSISAKGDDKSGLSMKFTEEFPAGENTDEGESIAEEISEGVTDDAALQKVIISTAEAVESFSLDRDEPEGGESSPLDTPRGPPEDSHFEGLTVPQPEPLEKVADTLIGEVIEESIKDVVDLTEKQQDGESLGEVSPKPKSSSFLELITEGAIVTPPISPIPVVAEQPVELSKDQLVHREVESLMKTLLLQTVDEMIRVKDDRDNKWRSRQEDADEGSPDDSPVLKTPEQVLPSPGLLKVSTPYTPDSEGTTPGDDLDSPLPDELFINRVKVESAISGIRDGDDNTPRARPTSPIFGESGSINPQALSHKLELLQALDQDIFGADIFGGQEWFDDDFGSMPKSNSIIKVPRRAADDGMVTSRSPSPEEPLPKYNEARHVELKKMVEEPFMAVPHNEKDVSQIMDKAVKVVHEGIQAGDPVESLLPTAIVYGSDTIGSDIESTSKKAYKHLVFDLAKETYRAVQSEQEPVTQPTWMKPKRRPRKFLFAEPPKTVTEMRGAVNTQALRILGLGRPQAGETFIKYSVKKKRDKVDEILIQELREEEQEWVDYDDDELSVKMQLTESIFASLLTDTAAVVSRIQEARLSREQQPQSDSDIEF